MPSGTTHESKNPVFLLFPSRLAYNFSQTAGCDRPTTPTRRGVKYLGLSRSKVLAHVAHGFRLARQSPACECRKSTQGVGGERFLAGCLVESLHGTRQKTINEINHQKRMAG